jgi:sulfur carrier protein ThiS
MRVILRFDPTLKDYMGYLPGESGSFVDLPPGSSIDDLLKKLVISSSDIGFIQLNGRLAQPSNILNENDEVYLFPCLVGG